MQSSLCWRVRVYQLTQQIDWQCMSIAQSLQNTTLSLSYLICAQSMHLAGRQKGLLYKIVRHWILDVA